MLPPLFPVAERPLVRLPALQSLTVQPRTGVVGSPDPPWPRPFPAGLRGPARSPSSVPFRIRIHPLVRFGPLQSSSDVSPPGASRRRAPPLGSRSPSRHRRLVSTYRGLPTTRYVPSSPFHTTSTVSSTCRLAGLFHPAATSGIHSSGAFPLAKPYRFSPAAALLPFSSAPYHRRTDGARKRRPTSGLFSERESVTTRGGLDRESSDPLLSFHLLRVLLRAPYRRLPVGSVLDLSRSSTFSVMRDLPISCETNYPVQGSRPASDRRSGKLRGPHCEIGRAHV